MNEQAKRIEVLGERLIRALHNIVSAARIHKDNNQLVRDYVSQFFSVISDTVWGDEITVEIWRGRFHMQGEKLLYQRETFTVINEMLEYFSRRNLMGLHLLGDFRKTVPEALLAFIRLLNDSVSREDPPAWIEEQLNKYDLRWVDVFPKQEEPPLFDMKLKEKALHAYSHALEEVKDVAEKASHSVAGVRKARRLAQTMVDLIQDDTSLMVGLTSIREYDDYTYTHSVNVALLATCLGKRIGLSQLSLEHLIICGLFHDLGKVGVPKDIILKESKLSNDEWEQMQRHPLIGVRKILRLQAPRSLRSRIILGPFEHHLNPDLSGYPKTHFMKRLSLFGKILRIADVYDALTSERSYRPRAFSPEEALRNMWKARGTNFDPVLLKIFVDMIGIYPVGTILELDSREIGLVMDYPVGSDKTSPLIMILEDDGQGGIRRGRLIDLSCKDQSSEQKRHIIRGLPLSHLGVQPAQLFLQEAV